jgi:Tol biopolymer transport system component
MITKRTLIAIGAAGICLAAAAPAWATFPGANGRIAFSTGVGHGPSQIATVEPDGSDVRYLTAGFRPAWSADGRRIAFSRTYHRRNSDVFVMRADGSHVRRLTSTPHWLDVSAEFSPDGRKIVFTRTFLGASPRALQMVVMRLDDLKMRVVTTEGIAPEWAPNGRRIVFVSDREATNGRIATIRPDGTDEHQLTFHANSYDADAFPAYAPDGRTIYFVHTPWDGPCSLMSVAASGGPLRRVPGPHGCPYNPAPAPAGGCVVSAWDSPDGYTDLYALGQRCPVQGWLNGQGQQASWRDTPSWQPLP